MSFKVCLPKGDPMTIEEGVGMVRRPGESLGLPYEAPHGNHDELLSMGWEIGDWPRSASAGRGFSRFLASGFDGSFDGCADTRR